MLQFFFKGISLIIFLLVSVALYTLAERKILGSIQLRTGPNSVGFFGLLQPFADGLKLILKEILVPFKANSFIYFLAPCIAFSFSVIPWAILPYSERYVLCDSNLSLLIFFVISSLSTYSIILAGWSSNSRYAFLGSLRSTAQLISYELLFGIIILTIVLLAGSLNIIDIVLLQEDCWLIFPLFPCFVMFLIANFAETNRAPFDLPEAEAELVSGYNVEYSSINFALFFIGEYLNVISAAALTSLLFLGGWLFYGVYINLLFSLKILLHLFLFVWIRACLPRYRYDNLMGLCWQSLIPLAFFFFFVVFLFLLFIFFSV